MSVRKLSEEQWTEACRLFALGWSLGEIAETIGCDVYSLSPHLRALAESAGIDWPSARSSQ